MKTFRVFGAIFFVIGFFFALLGILASVFPLIQNEQIKLILNSFQQTSPDTLTNTLNAIVIFCLRFSYILLFCGISLMVAVGLISSSANNRRKAVVQEPEFLPVSRPAAETLGAPRPAYYPGGLEPPADLLQFEQDERVSISLEADLDEDEREPFHFPTDDTPKPGPIAGAVELSFSLEEFDSQKLMQHDRHLTAEKTPEKAAAPDYTLYMSNAIPAEPRNEPVEIPADQPQGKPKIISTMGKRKR